MPLPFSFTLFNSRKCALASWHLLEFDALQNLY